MFKKPKALHRFFRNLQSQRSLLFIAKIAILDSLNSNYRNRISIQLHSKEMITKNARSV